MLQMSTAGHLISALARSVWNTWIFYITSLLEVERFNGEHYHVPGLPMQQRRVQSVVIIAHEPILGWSDLEISSHVHNGPAPTSTCHLFLLRG